MKRNIYKHVFFSAIVLLLVVSFSACKKEKELITFDSEGSKLVFSVSSQVASVDGNKIASIKSFTPQAKSSSSYISNKVSMITDVQESRERGGLLDFENKLNKKLASASPVHDYTRYRIILFNVTKDSIEKSVEAEASKNLELAVTPGDEYKWYAYSYNTLGRIDTPEIVNNVPVIRTADKEFLWASSGSTAITASNDPIAVSITFEHKVAEVVLEIDTKALYGHISDLRIDFDDPNYFNSAEINLFTGEASNVLNYNIPSLSLDDFEYDLSSDSTVLRAVMYTAVPQNKIENLKVNIRKMSVLQDNNKTNEVHKLSDSTKSVQFSFTNPHSSKSHVASMKFRYTIPTKRILHVTGVENDDDIKWAFAGQPNSRTWTDGSAYVETAHKPPFNMLKANLNFGLDNNSVFQTSGFTHSRCLNDGTLNLKLASVKPDIVIIAIYYAFDSDDITALKQYIADGGVVIMMTDSGVPAEVTTIQSFLNSLLGQTNIALNSIASYATSTMFPLANGEEFVDSPILNGPFGDLRGKFWGSDTHPVLLASNLPIGSGTNQVTIYSDNTPVNRAVDGTGVPMFKHNSKNFFWIGDGSFLSTPAPNFSGWSTGWDAEPFATVSTSQANPHSGPTHVHYPVPKRYGQDYNNSTLGDVGYSHGSEVYNAPLFANLMAWAIYRSEFFGINEDGPGVNDWSVGSGKNDNLFW